MRTRLTVVASLLAGLLLLFGLGREAFAHHGPPGSHLVAVGPVDPAHGYPIWYQDSTGLTLEVCLNIAADLLCGLDPALELPDPSQPVSFPGNFPGEAFWWSAGADMKTPASKNILVLALEAAFNPEVIARENEIAFGRIRFRMTDPRPGTYTFTHPYGVDTIVVTDEDTRLFVTEDIGADVARDFGTALKSRIGPFLTVVPDGGDCPAPPQGYIGDAISPCQVAGSPFDTNYFRIEGPGVAGVTDPADNEFPCPGDKAMSLDCIQTDRFVVMGKIATKYGADVTRATYTRGAWDPGIEVFASTRAPTPALVLPSGQVVPPIPQQSLEVSVGATVTPMLTDGTGKYFAFIEGDFAPTTAITATNTTDAVNGFSTAVTQGLADVVTIKEAYYYRGSQTLEIVAASSDEVTPATLAAYGDDGAKLGDLTAGPEGLMLVLSNVIVPPRQVVVRSSHGGSAAQLVDIGRCERAGNSQQCVPPRR